MYFFNRNIVAALMVKPTLIYLMLVLTVFQSSIAMGDVDQITQSGSDNFSINNILIGLGEIDPPETNIDPLEEEHDCSHCSLCHGDGCPVILVKTLSFTFQKARTNVPDYRKRISSEVPSPLQRPPILRS